MVSPDFFIILSPPHLFSTLWFKALRTLEVSDSPFCALFIISYKDWNCPSRSLDRSRPPPLTYTTLSKCSITMKTLAAYLLAVLGGEEAPSKASITRILSSVSIEVDDEAIDRLLAAVEGKVRITDCALNFPPPLPS